MVRVGLIGCGAITQRRHAPEYSQNPDAVTAAWFDTVPERAQQMAEKYGGRVYPTWQAVIDSGEVDAVSICSPNRMHAAMSIYALERGLNVLCEKPMATTLDECERMVAAARAAKKILMIGQNQRLAPAHVKAREMIQGGTTGRVLSFETHFGHGGPETWSVGQGAGTWFFKRNASGYGVLFDLGVHKIDLIHFLLGEYCEEVGAILATRDKTDDTGMRIDVDDNAVCVLRMQSGVVGTMAASWTYYGGEDNSTTLYCENGILQLFRDPRYALIWLPKDGRVRRYALSSIQTNDRQTKSGVIDAFVRDVEAGRRVSSCVDGEQVLMAMRTAFAAARSFEDGRFEKV